MESKVLSSIKPLYRLFHFCGFLCLKPDVTNNKIIVASRIYTVTSAFAFSMITGVLIALYISERTRTIHGTFQHMGTIIYMCTIATKIIVVTMMRSIRAAELALLWSKMMKIERDFNSCKIQLKSNILKYEISMVAVHSSLIVLYVVYVAFFANVLHNSTEVVGFILFQLLNVRILIVGVEFTAFFTLLEDYFRQLNLFLRDFVDGNNEGRKRLDLKVFRGLFAILYSTSGDICRVLSPQVLAILAEAMVVLTFRSYIVFSKVYDRTNTKHANLSIALSFFWIWNSCLSFFLIITPSYMCTRNANRIKRTLRNIEFYSRGPAVARNIKSFSLQLLHEDFKITAGGLFTIDLSLAYMVIGALTTYITIIVQFDLMYFK